MGSNDHEIESYDVGSTAVALIHEPLTQARDADIWITRAAASKQVGASSSRIPAKRKSQDMHPTKNCCCQFVIILSSREKEDWELGCFHILLCPFETGEIYLTLHLHVHKRM